MYQVILRLVFIARHTRKATDHCFSFLYPRRDVHEVSVLLLLLSGKSFTGQKK